MADIPEALKRNYKDVYVCQRCNATNRSGSGLPRKCRKCGSTRFRQKKKKRKAAAA